MGFILGFVFFVLVVIGCGIIIFTIISPFLMVSMFANFKERKRLDSILDSTHTRISGRAPSMRGKTPQYHRAIATV